MACIVKQPNRKSGVTYIYRQQSYWVPELKQPRCSRVLIGWIEPVTGEILPTGKSGPRKSSKRQQETVVLDTGSMETAEQKKDLLKATARIQDLEREAANLKTENRLLRARIMNIQVSLVGAQSAVNRTLEHCIADCTEDI